MKIKLLVVLIIALFFLTELKFLNRSIVENDEGIYWATFLLVNKGYSLYSEVSFSQLPGFFLAVYPIFKIFGTIVAARLTILFWSILALLSIVWLGYIRKNLLFGLISVVLLISIPSFFNQAISFQSDIMAASFSAMSFVFMMAYLEHSSRLSSNYKWKYLWLILSSFFFSFALLTKFDYSLVLPFGFLFLFGKKERFFNILLFILTSPVIIFATLLFFGLDDIANNVLTLRAKALAVYQFEPLKIIELLKKEVILLIFIAINIFYAMLNWKKDNFFTTLFLWFISSLFLVFSFRPLFPHHLVFLAVPTVLLFAYLFTSIKHLIEVKFAILLIIVTATFISNISELVKRQNSRFIKERIIAEKYILANTSKNDVILTDEAALYGMTGRLPPPELVDTSFVQIESGNISPEKFKAIIEKYQPKLILAWNGRLNTLQGFENILEGYKKINFAGGKKMFIRSYLEFF